MDLHPVEGCGLVRIDGKVSSLSGVGQLLLEHDFTIGMQLHTVLMGGIIGARMEIAHREYHPLAGKIGFATHQCIPNGHPNTHRATNEVAYFKVLKMLLGILGGGVHRAQRIGIGHIVLIAAGSTPNLLAHFQQILPHIIVFLGGRLLRGRTAVAVEYLKAGPVRIPVIQGIGGIHVAVGQRMDIDKHAAILLNNIDQLGHLLLGGGAVTVQIGKVPAACQFIRICSIVIFRIILGIETSAGIQGIVFLHRVDQTVGIREDHVKVHLIISGCDQTGRHSHGLRAADKDSIVPDIQLHMQRLLMVHDGGKVHIQRIHGCFPNGQVLMTIGSAAGSSMVMELAVVGLTTFIGLIQKCNIRFLGSIGICRRRFPLTATTGNQAQQHQNRKNKGEYFFHKPFLHV